MKCYSKGNGYDALREADISTACLLDDVAVNQSSDINLEELQKDIEHILNQIQIALDYIENV